MNVNWNQFYVGTRAIEEKEMPFKVWKAGVEVVAETTKSEVELPQYDKVAVYDFGLTPEGDTVTFEELKNIPHEENTIYQFSGGKFMEEINQRIGNKFAADADQREWVVRTKQEVEERNEKSSDCVQVLTEKERRELDQIAARYAYDQDNVLNHSFVNDAFDLDKLFDKFAVGYAKYLNNNIESAYDDVKFRGFEDEEKYRDIVKKEMRSAVGHMLNYFMFGEETEEDIDRVSGQLADGAIKYAHQVADGDRNLNHLDAKVTINGLDVQYCDLLYIQNALYEQNKQGINGKAFDYCGLGNNYDTSGMEELGKKTWEVKKMCKYDLSEELGNMILHVYEKRTENIIDKNHIDFMKTFYSHINQSIKGKMQRTGNYSNAGFEELKKVYQYEGSNFEQAYNKYAMRTV